MMLPFYRKNRTKFYRKGQCNTKVGILLVKIVPSSTKRAVVTEVGVSHRSIFFMRTNNFTSKLIHITDRHPSVCAPLRYALLGPMSQQPNHAARQTIDELATKKQLATKRRADITTTAVGNSID